MDGIYFQTLTEHSQTVINGKTVAMWACELVNEVASALYAEEPNLYIQFGLHATSIRDHYSDLKSLDPRITIVWEDAGSIPYASDPVTESSGSMLDSAASPERTIDYSKRLATFRGKTELAMVAKGWTTLRWADDFEHHGPFILGERDADFIRRRGAERQPRWDKVNALWLRNYPYAARFYREILALSPAKMTVIGLVEDGILEETIPISVALFAETLWNPERDPDEALQLALSPYYRQAWT